MCNLRGCGETRISSSASPKQCHFARNSSSDQCDTNVPSPEVHLYLSSQSPSLYLRLHHCQISSFHDRAAIIADASTKEGIALGQLHFESVMIFVPAYAHVLTR
ncbi:hypothetical protein Tco_1555332 [Tanacetum coccineum]